jgi:hypothetical protein
MGADTALTFPAFGPATVWRYTRSVLLQAPGPDWLFKRAGAMSAFNISCTNPMRMRVKGSKRSANARTREAWVEKRKAATAAAVPAAAAAVPSKKTAVAPLAEVKAALPAAGTAALPAADIAVHLERD